MIIDLVENCVTGRSYVGQTSRSLDQRWQQHVYAALKGNDKMPLLRAIRKYGPEAFTKRVLQQCDNPIDLDEAEKFWIRELKTRTNGYNATDGGHGVSGYKHTDDAKRKMSAARSGEKNCNFGKKLSPETREKISQSKIGTGTGPRPHASGWHHRDEARKKIGQAQYVSVAQYDMSGNLLSTFASMIEAEEKTGVPRQGISRCCRLPHRSAGGFQFRYLKA